MKLMALRTKPSKVFTIHRGRPREDPRLVTLAASITWKHRPLALSMETSQSAFDRSPGAAGRGGGRIESAPGKAGRQRRTLNRLIRHDETFVAIEDES